MQPFLKALHQLHLLCWEYDETDRLRLRGLLYPILSLPASRELAQVLTLRLHLPDGPCSPQNMMARLFSSTFVRGTAHSILATAGLASTTLLLDDHWRGFYASDEPGLVVGRGAYQSSGTPRLC